MNKEPEIVVEKEDSAARPKTICIWEWALPGNQALMKSFEPIIQWLTQKQEQILVYNKEIEVGIIVMCSSENGQGSIMISPELINRLNGLNSHILFDVYLTD